MLKRAKNALDLGIIVSDIKASLDFYQHLLGLEFVGLTPLPFGTMHRLRFGDTDFKLVDPFIKPPRGPIGLECQTGFRYVTFPVTNISEVCAKLKEKGIEFYWEEREFRPGVFVAMVKDPDGNMVEFVQK